MMLFAIGIKHPLDVAVQRLHDADAREHRRAAQRRDKRQGFHGSLPLWRFVLGLGKLGDIGAGVLEGDELTPAGQRDWIFERTLPTLSANGASPFCRTRSQSHPA